MDDNLHARLVGVITEALTDIESGAPVNIAIDISNSAVNVEFYIEGQKRKTYQYPFGEEIAGSAASRDGETDAPHELALGNMVQIRHGDRFLPNPGKIISMSTSLVAAPDYLVEYWLNGEPISKWFAGGYLEFYAVHADAAQQREIVEDAAAALRHEVRQKAKAPIGDRGESGPSAPDVAARAASFNSEGPFITPLATGECLSGFTFIDNVAAAACAHGMSGSVSIHFSKDEAEKGEKGDKGERGERGEKGDPGAPGAPGKPAASDAEDIARP